MSTSRAARCSIDSTRVLAHWKGLTVPVAGFRLSACEVGVSAVPQVAGAQNEQVLKSLGYLNDDIASMRVDGVI